MPAEISHSPRPKREDVRSLALRMLCWHESRNGKLKIGDAYKAHGFYQQHKGHWDIGARKRNIKIPYPEGAYNFEAATQVVLGNWDVYCPDATTVDELILAHRIPNSNKRYRKDNLDYLRRVKLDWKLRKESL